MLETVLDLKDLFNEKGYRYTAQREKILDILKQQSAKHLTAVDICVLVKKKYPKIGVATVYRTLSIFEKLNMIQKLGPDNELNRYEFNTSHDDHEHNHLICIKCGMVKDIKENVMGEMSKNILKNHNFVVNGFNQKLYGICEDCLMKDM